MTTTTPPADSLLAKFAHWATLYAAYLYLAGWGYLRTYYHVFGVGGSSLDIGFNDTLAQGFAVLFGSGWALSLIYVVVFGLSVVVEMTALGRRTLLRTALPTILVAFFPVTYLFATRAGIDRANIDRGQHTTLPSMAFTAGTCAYNGKLVHLKGDLLYVYNLAYLGVPHCCDGCPLDLSNTSPSVPQLWLIRAADIRDVRVIHYAKEVAP